MDKPRPGNSNLEIAADPSRRNLLKRTALGLIGGLAAPILAGQASSFAEEKKSGNVLIVYFSRTGNTREVANQIHQLLGGDIIEIKTLHPYPEEYRATTEQAKQEQETNFRPQIITETKNMDSYGRVFMGYPN